ncbi:UbiA prenyltransferase family-domain-containing protein [Sordaria brevicollis]|uniref:UbiA prenyltransferase family-domain-containing protein n=1 Tax=Sordaria brevicollis TaxID=83679 RepID=A0AAE0UFG8_SORBR|nr:UbiA prenyltransferase family-domain-containing protein [Sordaria brevicollis]
MSTILHNKPAPTLGRLWSIFGTGSWGQSTPNSKLKSDADAEDKSSSKVETITQKPLLPAGSLMGNVSAVIYLLWEFSKNDIFNFSLPCTIFGVALSLAKEATTSPGATPSLSQVLHRLPAICLFQLYSLLLFDLANQRHPIAVAEDLINKPWRPIPSDKITSDQTRRLFLCMVPVALALNCALGVWHEGLLVLIVIFVYNDLGCADEPVFRDILLGLSYGIYHVGSLRIALGLGQHAAAAAAATNGQGETGMGLSMADVISPRGYAWTAIVSALIATMIPVQDFKDLDGDRARGNRTTLPLLIGETASRYQLAATALVWAVVGVSFWKTPVWYAAPFVGYAGYIAWRLLARRNKVDDEVTWRNWCRWTMMVYSLPAVSALGW